MAIVGLYGDAWKAEPLTLYNLLPPENIMINLFSATTSGVAILGLSLMSMNALFHM